MNSSANRSLSMTKIKGFIDEPKYQTFRKPIVSGVFDFLGWAISPSGISRVEVLVDGVLYQEAYYGMLRYDVARAWPDIVDSGRSGFFSKIDSERFADGVHRLSAKIYDNSGGVSRLNLKVRVSNQKTEYDEWYINQSVSFQKNEVALKAKEAALQGSRLFLLLMRIDEESEISLIQATLASFEVQQYPHWKLFLFSKAPQVTPIKKWAQARHLLDKIIFIHDSFFDFRTLEKSLSNVSVGFISPGDVLDSFAFLAFAAAYGEDSSLDLVYSDEDVLLNGRHLSPVFKPAWSPVLFKEFKYLGRLWFINFDTVIRSLNDANVDVRTMESLILERLSGDTIRAAHIPSVLCSRHTEHYYASCSALSGHAQKYAKPHDEDSFNTPLVSIIMPTCIGNLSIFEACLDSLFERTHYERFELILLVNGVSDLDEKAQLLKKWPLKIVYWDKPFNWSAINNFGVSHARGSYFIFMNDDVEIVTPDWIERMLNLSEAQNVGVVGATLRYPNGTIQHAGLFLTPHSPGADHLYRFFSGHEKLIYPWVSNDRECSAVTGACLLTKASVFHEIGGFNERLQLVCNDVDYCLQAAKHGYTTLISAHAELIHHEGVSRLGLEESPDTSLFRERWGHLLLMGDPYFNPNFGHQANCRLVREAAADPFLARVNGLVNAVSTAEKT